jgi:hypothetical protein
VQTRGEKWKDERKAKAGGMRRRLEGKAVEGRGGEGRGRERERARRDAARWGVEKKRK